MMCSHRNVMLAAVLQLVHHTAAVSYSRLRYGTCDTANRHQKFELDGARIKDVETGRCVAVQGCRLDFPYVDQGVSDPNNAFGHVVLDVCGSDACGGKSTQWKQSTPDLWESELSAGHTPAHCYGLNVVSKKDPTTNHNAAEGVWELIVWPFSPAEPCLVAADNTIFHFTAATGQLRVGATSPISDAQSADGRGSWTGCGDATNCCVQAYPCVAPCELSS